MTLVKSYDPDSVFSQHLGAGSRVAWMDLARLISALWVVTIHVATVSVENMKTVPMKWWWWANLYDSASRAAVPLFIMLSGAILLTQEPWNARRFFSRRAAKLLPPLIGWTLIYLCWQSWIDGNHIGAKEISKSLLDGLDEPSYAHLWFLWVIASLYLLTPIFQPFVAQGSRSTHLYYGLIWFTVTAIFPLIQRWSGIRIGLMLDSTSGLIGYYILGGSLHRFLPRLSSRLVMTSWLVFFLCVGLTAWGTYTLSQAADKLNESMMEASAGNVILMTLAAFLLLRHYGTLWTDATPETKTWRERLAWASSLTFGIYLSHPLIIEMLGWVGLPRYPMPFNPGWYVPLVTAFAFTIAGVLTALLRAIPVAWRLVP